MSEAAIFSMRILIQEYLLLEFLKLVILSNNSYSDTGEESYRTYFLPGTVKLPGYLPEFISDLF